MQPNRRTVCGIIEEFLFQILRRRVRLTVAGRTDAGVHATGQVAHMDIPPSVDLNTLLHRLSRALPADVRVTALTEASPDFDARFTALRRHYAYRVCDTQWRANPLNRGHVVTWPRPLDVPSLNAASELLLGEHDFVAFCKRREGATTIRELQQLAWTREGDILTARVAADAFCHSMVRSLVGALLAVGEGRKPVTWPSSMLSAAERPSAITVAPAHGLTLTQVDYPATADLAARATQTRRIRTR